MHITKNDERFKLEMLNKVYPVVKGVVEPYIITTEIDYFIDSNKEMTLPKFKREMANHLALRFEDSLISMGLSPDVNDLSDLIFEALQGPRLPPQGELLL